ncbi:MAG: hypothetical protein JOZ62_13780 [Acidobacteriaceae bacterium]|nr:hypothetical protein [Acidobacteriaceae bacterium]
MAFAIATNIPRYATLRIELFVMSKTLFYLVPFLFSIGTLVRGAENPEDFRLEITGAAWVLNPSGAIQSSGTPVDLVKDLNVQQQQPTFYGKLVFKPGRKHRIVIEGTPFRLSGLNTVSRTVTYRGQIFTVNQTLKSSADLDYVFGGYQYDVISGEAGHLGFSVGAAYLGATGVIQSVQTQTIATKSLTLGLPLAGTEFRAFPVPGHRWIDINGGIRGMALGSYGNYLEASGNGGVWVRHIGLEAGYRAVNANIHDTSSAGSGVAVHLKGPIFSAMWKW